MYPENLLEMIDAFGFRILDISFWVELVGPDISSFTAFQTLHGLIFDGCDWPFFFDAKFIKLLSFFDCFLFGRKPKLGISTW